MRETFKLTFTLSDRVWKAAGFQPNLEWKDTYMKGRKKDKVKERKKRRKIRETERKMGITSWGWIAFEPTFAFLSKSYSFWNKLALIIGFWLSSRLSGHISSHRHTDTSFQTGLLYLSLFLSLKEIPRSVSGLRSGTPPLPTRRNSFPNVLFFRVPNVLFQLSIERVWIGNTSDQGRKMTKKKTGQRMMM